MDEDARNDTWWVKTRAGEHGPVDLDTLREWVNEGRIAPTNLVRREGVDQWTRAAAVVELASFFPVRFAPAARG